jgi:hypothetical protein
VIAAAAAKSNESALKLASESNDDPISAPLFPALASDQSQRHLLTHAITYARSSANLARTAGVEPTPPEWRSGTLPLSHVRQDASKDQGRSAAARAAVLKLVGRDGIEPPKLTRGVYSALGSPVPSLPVSRIRLKFSGQRLVISIWPESHRRPAAKHCSTRAPSRPGKTLSAGFNCARNDDPGAGLEPASPGEKPCETHHAPATPHSRLLTTDCGIAGMEEGEGVEPSTRRSARLSRPVAHHCAPPSKLCHGCPGAI